MHLELFQVTTSYTSLNAAPMLLEFIKFGRMLVLMHTHYIQKMVEICNCKLIL
jgi:hypothetical protein